MTSENFERWRDKLDGESKVNREWQKTLKRKS